VGHKIFYKNKILKKNSQEKTKNDLYIIDVKVY